MAYLKLLLHFLQGTYSKFGTSANLFREISVSVLTAVAVAVFVQLLTPTPESPITEMRELLASAVANQHLADSLKAKQVAWKLQGTIDSLTTVLKKRDEQDSLRANSQLSTLDAMQQINGAIDKARTAAARR